MDPYVVYCACAWALIRTRPPRSLCVYVCVCLCVELVGFVVCCLNEGEG